MTDDINLSIELLSNVHLGDIINLNEIQRLQDLFAEASGVASIITNPDGTPFTNPSNFCGLCKNIRKSFKGSAKCLISNKKLGKYHPEGPVIQPCIGCGMLNAGASITVGNKHIATWIIGQVRIEEPEESVLFQYADDIGVDREEFVKEMKQVPVMSFEQFSKVSNMLFAFANEISEKAYSNFKLKLEIAEHEKEILKRKEAEEQFKALFERSIDATFLVDLSTGHYLNANKAAESLTGRTVDELIKLKTSDLTPKEAGKRLDRISNTREPVELGEVEYSRPDGTIRTALLTSIPLNNNLAFGIAHDITVRKQLDRAFKDSNSITEATLESIHNGILVVNDQGAVIKTNAKFASIWQIPEDILAVGDDNTLIGCILDRLSDPEQFIAKVTELYSEPEAESFDTIYLKDGRILDRISRPFYLEGKPKGRVWSFLDVTEQKMTQEMIDNERLVLRTLVDNLPDSIYCKDLACRKTLVNLVELQYMKAQSEAEVLGKDDFDFYPRELAEQFYADDQLVLQTGVPVLNREEYVIDENGQKRWLLTSKLPLRDKDNQIVGLIGIGRDITDRKLAEDKLMESEHLLSKAQEMAQLGPWSLDLTTNQLTWSDEIYRIFGLRPQEFPATYEAFLEAVHPDDRQTVDAAYSNSIREKKSSYEIEHRIVRKHSGEIRYVYEKCEHIMDQSGRIIRSIGLVHDITGRKQAEIEIKLKNEQLIQAHAEKDKFFSIIAHDLRNPFSSFLALTQIMDEQLSNLSMEDIHELTHSMKNSASNLYRLLENLLQWARMKQGLIPFNPTMVQLREMIDESISITQEPAKNKGIDLTNLVSEAMEVFADTNTLQTVIRNLVSNAFKFTPKGGKISLAAIARDDQSIEISITDTGIGMTQSMVENLFRSDVRVSRPGTEGEPSTGLGLLLCKEFIEKQGGKIWVDSQEGKGSEFHFTVPCQ